MQKRGTAPLLFKNIVAKGSKMIDSVGDPQFPIWLVGDSPPKNWDQELETPLDARHPARHNIWTSVADYMQDVLYREKSLRLNTANLYIRNAISKVELKPGKEELSWPRLQEEIESWNDRLQKYKPRAVLTFGAFAFELLRRAEKEEPPRPFGNWGTRELGAAFRERLRLYNPLQVNVVPLLHVSIARGRFLHSHRYFVGGEGSSEPNYFDYVGNKLAILFMQHMAKEKIWIT